MLAAIATIAGGTIHQFIDSSIIIIHRVLLLRMVMATAIRFFEKKYG